MKRERPVPVLVLALAGVLVGGLGAVGAGLVQAAGGTSGAVVPLEPAAAEQLRRTLTGFRAFEVFLPGTALLLAVLVLAVSLALFGMRRWARVAALTAAGAVLLVVVTAMIYESAVVLPEIEDWRYRVRSGSPPHDAVPARVQALALLLLVGGLILLVHAVATVVVLTAPSVAEAFAPPGRTQPPGPRPENAEAMTCDGSDRD